MARVIDLDAAKAARAEAAGESASIRFAEKDWTLPAELPWAVAEAAAGGDGPAAMRAIELLLGDQWPAFKAEKPSLADIMVIVEAVGEIYGTDPKA